MRLNLRGCKSLALLPTGFSRLSSLQVRSGSYYPGVYGKYISQVLCAPECVFLMDWA